jgi:hypothetical protein
VANEWGKAGEHAFRFVLKTGTKATDVAAELKDKVAPIGVRAPDDFTLVFESPDLTESALLEKLATLPLGGGDKAKADAVAALTGLGGEGPALSDLSSAGSIRVSRAIELPGELSKKGDPLTLTGQVVKVCECGAVPSVVIKVLSTPRRGEHRKAFRIGQPLSVRGYFKVKDAANELDAEDARTKINLATKDLKPGDKVWGRPLQKDGDEWVVETLQKY